jgi:hypothetical protein
MRKSFYITLAALLVIMGTTATINLRAQQKKSEPEKPKTACPMMKKHDPSRNCSATHSQYRVSALPHALRPATHTLHGMRCEAP